MAIQNSKAQERARRHLSERRRSKGLTQEQLALEMGISRSYITKLENGTKPLNLHQLDTIARILECDVSYFLTPIDFER